MELKAQKVLVTGANGYIGSAVARAFARTDWVTYGLVRNENSLTNVAANEVRPILGAPADLSFIDKHHDELHDLDVVVSTTEQIMDYIPHYNEIVAMLRRLGALSESSGKRLLVFFTSGCKDYGTTGLHGSPNLAPHSEDFPINAPPFAMNRATYSSKIFEHADAFDAVLLRPTSVYGYTSSFYGKFFELAAEAKASNAPLTIAAEPNTVMHSMHVDDCGDVYRLLAEHPDRAAITGHCFNISGRKYETLRQTAEALAREYDLKQGVAFKPEDYETADFITRYGFGFSQWVASDKIRKLLRWRDARPLFSEAIHRYRIAYDAAKAGGHEDVGRTDQKTKRIV